VAIPAGSAVAGTYRWTLLIAAEGLGLAIVASSVKISPLVLQLFRALLTF
jgi:hypothetical protein